MKNFSKLFILAVFFGLMLWANTAPAGQAGVVSCTAPGCGYQTNLKIGGGRKSPSLTGYCPATKKFVRIKLKSWEGYREKVPPSAECPVPVKPIYDAEDVAQILCPQCGKLTLSYKMTLRFD